jgi:hypothetical protein
MKTDVICKEVIITDLTTRGEGISYSPIRRITQVWDKDGVLIAEHDPFIETEQLQKELHNFIMFIYTKTGCPIDIDVTLDAYLKEREERQ